VPWGSTLEKKSRRKNSATLLATVLPGTYRQGEVIFLFFACVLYLSYLFSHFWLSRIG